MFYIALGAASTIFSLISLSVIASAKSELDDSSFDEAPRAFDTA